MKPAFWFIAGAIAIATFLITLYLGQGHLEPGSPTNHEGIQASSPPKGPAQSKRLLATEATAREAYKRDTISLPDHVNTNISALVDQLIGQGYSRLNFDRDSFTNTNPLIKIDSTGQIQLYLHVKQMDEATLQALDHNGFHMDLANDALAIVQGWAHFEDIAQIANLSVIDRIEPPKYAMVNQGSVTTEGDALHFTSLLRGQGLNGSGIRIGVISDGATDMADAVATGDLPSNVQSYGTCTKRVEDRTECLSSWDCNEGTAMMEIIHDMVPEASLAIGAVGTSLEFVQRIDDLANSFGAHIIVDDLGFLGEPYFADGDLADAVAAVAGRVVYVSSAGNSRDSHYEADYLSRNFDVLGDTYDLHDFVGGDASIADGSFNFNMTNGGYLLAFMQWNDEFGKSSNNYDLLVVNDAEDTILTQSNETQNGTQDPFEAVCYHNNSGGTLTTKLLVNKVSGDDKRLEMFAFGRQVSNQFNTQSGSVFGHAAVPAAIAVAAAHPDAPTVTADYSSLGPSRIDFPSRMDREKPDITGIAGVSVTGTGGFPSTFFGTSAAAPHVAAVAAQLLQFSPESTPAVIKRALMLSADEIGSAGFDYFAGAGRADAFDARNYLQNNADDDSDNDGVVDLEDAFPNDATETLDTDGDNIGNVADNDDDGDGTLDAVDIAPLDASRSESIASGSDDASLPNNSARAYLMTTSTSRNVSKLHIINTASTAQSFSGTLYDGTGERLGSANNALNTTAIPAKGRLVLSAADLELLFGVSPWSGPAMLQVYGDDSFEVMIKLTSPSGLVSNTNCVREGSVSNVEGFDSADLTYIRLINTSSATLSGISGTLYGSDGSVIGSENTTLVSSLEPNAATWLNRNQLSELFSDTWNGPAHLDVNDQDGLKLLNLNFINSETFFNFSCYESVEPDNLATSCTEPRPDACTQEIDYVCAARDSGSETTEFETYSNACSACSVATVSEHYPGRCEDRLKGQ